MSVPSFEESAARGPHLISNPKLQRQWMMRVLWFALAVWIILLAIGTSMYAPAPGQRDHATIDWRRGAVILLFVGGFLATWIWLASRKRR